MNSELLVKRGMERIALTSWLRRNNVKFDERADTETLRQLYIKEETSEKTSNEKMDF